MRSIRSFLFINLLFSIIVVMVIVLIGNLSFSHKVFKEGLDIRLANDAIFLNTLLSQPSNINITKLQSSINTTPLILQNFLPNIETKRDHFQLYDNKGNLLIKSSDLKLSPDILKNNGFQDVLLDGILWRLFIYHSTEQPWVTATFQRYDIYDIVEEHLLQDSIFITLS